MKNDKMQCEICGKETQLVVAIIEGSELNVCSDCAKFGKVIKKPVEKVKEQKEFLPKKEIIESIVSDYSEKVRKAREKLGLKQEELALKIAEKESIIHKIESGHFKPSIDLAKKLEHFLKIKLIEQIESVTYAEIKGVKEKSENLTIGDIVKLK